jgi:superfamily II DNA or RNA helicase
VFGWRAADETTGYINFETAAGLTVAAVSDIEELYTKSREIIVV